MRVLLQANGTRDGKQVTRPTPDLDIHKQIYNHAHPGQSGIPTSYAEALHHHPQVFNCSGGHDRQCHPATACTQVVFSQAFKGGGVTQCSGSLAARMELSMVCTIRSGTST